MRFSFARLFYNFCHIFIHFWSLSQHNRIIRQNTWVHKPTIHFHFVKWHYDFGQYFGKNVATPDGDGGSVHSYDTNVSSQISKSSCKMDIEVQERRTLLNYLKVWKFSPTWRWFKSARAGSLWNSIAVLIRILFGNALHSDCLLGDVSINTTLTPVKFSHMY